MKIKTKFGEVTLGIYDTIKSDISMTSIEVIVDDNDRVLNQGGVAIESVARVLGINDAKHKNHDLTNYAIYEDGWAKLLTIDWETHEDKCADYGKMLNQYVSVHISTQKIDHEVFKVYIFNVAGDNALNLSIEL